MTAIATYRAHYGPIPPDETWFGFLALVGRASQQTAQRILDWVTGLRIAVGPLANEANAFPAELAVARLEDLARGR